MSRSRVIHSQMKKLLDLLSEDGVLVNGKVCYSNINRQIFWKRVALQLNSVENGVHKNTWKWCKMWADWKNKTKRKAEILQQTKHHSNGQQRSELTSLELRLLKMIEYPIDEKALVPGVVSNVEITETTEDELPDFLTESFDAQLSQDHIVFEEDDEDNATVEHIVTPTVEHVATNKRTFSNVGNTVIEVDSKDDGGESSDPEMQVKTKGKKYRKKNTALEEFKIRTTLELEKEKAQQKSEELRLRALELKLKGEEMRLKEMEMNKINYLTHLEEEKLKCFKEISGSLKEFLDRTRNGNMRFHSTM